MNQKYLEKLEFNKIKDILKSFAITYIGKNLADDLFPMDNKKEIEKALTQTYDASNLIIRKGNAPISEIEDITIHIKKLESSNFLTAKQLLNLAKILKMARNLKEYFSSEEIDMSEFTSLESLFNNLYSNSTIENSIYTNILDENTIADTASSELSTIRKTIKQKEQEIKSKLNSIIHSKHVQEPVVTLRNNRFVVPVKNESRQEVKGFIHDISQSGSTVFIEPLSVFDLNNDLNNLKNDEIIEIEKILQRLSSLFFSIIENLKNNINLIGIIDFIFAKAKYSNSIDANKPIICDEKKINLVNAYHPLLNKNQAVKNTIYLGEEFTNLIITGPNTGGKTVTLKTTGLLVAMALSGLNIPAKENSCVYIFDNIFVDIGDEQSIQDSLSTFSSHMVNISNILKSVTPNSLVLIDELGSGTDPVEGASLGISILESLERKNILTISTTHYPEIKEYALVNKNFKNASVEFDLDTLSPTYKLLIGVPGTSNAFNISKKLGISDEIINRAKELLKDDKIHIEELLTSIYKDKTKIENERKLSKENYEFSEKIKQELEKKLLDLKNKEKSIIEDAKIKARDILIDAKDEANEIIKELEKSKTNSQEANKLRNSLNNKITSLSFNTNTDNSKDLSKKLTMSDLKIDLEVFIPKLNQYGNIQKISNKNSIYVTLPLGKMNFKLEDLEKSNKSNSSKTTTIPKKKTTDFKPKHISTEINLLGQTVEEACFLIDKFLDNAALSSVPNVRIVHGKGTGALRQGIHKYLKSHPHVKSFRLGTFGEGEMGVTIVELK